MMFEMVGGPTWFHRFIISSKGQTIRKITQDFPTVHLEFSDKEEAVSLEGPQAKEAFEMFTRDLVSCPTSHAKIKCGSKDCPLLF